MSPMAMKKKKMNGLADVNDMLEKLLKNLRLNRVKFFVKFSCDNHYHKNLF